MPLRKGIFRILFEGEDMTKTDFLPLLEIRENIINLLYNCISNIDYIFISEHSKYINLIIIIIYKILNNESFIYLSKNLKSQGGDISSSSPPPPVNTSLPPRQNPKYPTIYSHIYLIEIVYLLSASNGIQFFSYPTLLFIIIIILLIFSVTCTAYSISTLGTDCQRHSS